MILYSGVKDESPWAENTNRVTPNTMLYHSNNFMKFL